MEAHISCSNPVGEIMLGNGHSFTPRTPTTPAAPTQNVNTGTKSQPESNGAERVDTTPILRLPSLVITLQQRLRMEQNQLRALKIRRRQQMEQNRGTQNSNSKEKGQAKTNSSNDTEDGTNKASDDKVRWLIQVAAAESGPQQLTGIKDQSQAFKYNEKSKRN